MTTITYGALPARAVAVAPRVRLRLTRRGRAVIAVLVSLPLVLALLSLGLNGGVAVAGSSAEPVTVTVEAGQSLWTLAVDLLTIGLRLNRIVTRDPAELGMRAPGRISNEERLYVYKRAGEPCRRCHTPIVWADVGGRRVWWCPRCQSERS